MGETFGLFSAFFGWAFRGAGKIIGITLLLALIMWAFEYLAVIVSLVLLCLFLHSIFHPDLDEISSLTAEGPQAGCGHKKLFIYYFSAWGCMLSFEIGVLWILADWGVVLVPESWYDNATGFSLFVVAIAAAFDMIVLLFVRLFQSIRE